MQKGVEALNRAVLLEQIATVVGQSQKESIQGNLFDKENQDQRVVVLVTNSVRKVWMAVCHLMYQCDVTIWPEVMRELIPGLHFTSEQLAETLKTPLDIDTFLSTHFKNGDGFLRKPVYLGVLPEGVPMIVCPTDGETDGNDFPVDEARRKSDDVKELFAQLGIPAIFITTDAVQQIKYHAHKLGKPRKHDYFPKNDDPHAVGIFLRWYIQEYYISKSRENLPAFHVTGVIVSDEEEELTAEIIFPGEIEADIVSDESRVWPSLDSGGGGVFQKVLAAKATDDPEFWFKQAPPEMQYYLQHFPLEKQGILVMMHILGWPGWIIQSGIRTLLEKKTSSREEPIVAQLPQLQYAEF